MSLHITPQDGSTNNTLLKRILYAIMNNGAIGLIPGSYPDNTLLRAILYQLQNGAIGGGGASQAKYFSVADVQAIPTIGLALPQLVPAIIGGVLQFFELKAGGGGDFQPNDYNAVTNNVSWTQVL